MELRNNGRLAAIVHGGVAVLPVGQDAQALEAVALDVDPLAGIGAALLAELGLGDLVLAAALAAQLLLDLPLDGQAVAVPAGHEVYVVAHGEARADDEVLQGLLQGVADMDGAIGVGRAVMQHEQRRAGRLPRLAGGVIEADLVPLGQNLRLLLRQTCAHGEVGLGQEDGLAIVAPRGFGGSGALFSVVGHGIFRPSRRRRRAEQVPARAGS